MEAFLTSRFFDPANKLAEISIGEQPVPYKMNGIEMRSFSEKNEFNRWRVFKID